MLARALLVLLCIAAPAAAQQNADWTRPFPPFKLIGNVYWVGTYDLSTYLITTDAGHILINTGFAETVPEIKKGVEQLGFEFDDVEILLATHAHGDHVAGLAELKRLTGAQHDDVRGRRRAARGRRRQRLSFRRPPKSELRGREGRSAAERSGHVALGGVTITAHHHPGHTKGATSFTLTVREGGRDYRVVIANMGSINPGVTVSGMPKYPTIGDDYARTFAAQKALPVDVFLASHAAQFGMHEKYKPGDAYDPNRFVDPQGYLAAVERLEDDLPRAARARTRRPLNDRFRHTRTAPGGGTRLAIPLDRLGKR